MSTPQHPSSEYSGISGDRKYMMVATQTGDEEAVKIALASQHEEIKRVLGDRAERALGSKATQDAKAAARASAAARADRWLELETMRTMHRIQRIKDRDALLQKSTESKKPQDPPPRTTGPPKARKPPAPPSDEEANVLIAHARDRLQGALEIAAVALSENIDDLLHEDPHKYLPSTDLHEIVEIADEVIASNTFGSGSERIKHATWGSIRRLWALRPAIVYIDIKVPLEKLNRRTRAEFARRVEGVVAAVVEHSDSVVGSDAQVKEWLRARDIRVLSPDELTSLRVQSAATDAIAYVRGGVLYLRALAERIGRVRYALDRVEKSHDYADADIDANKPLDHEAIFSAIEKHCDEGLRAAVGYAQRRLADVAEITYARIEPWISSHPSLLAVPAHQVRRNGGQLPDGVELFELNSDIVEELIIKISGDLALSPAQSAEKTHSLPQACVEVGGGIVEFCEGRLRDRIVWEMLRPTRLIATTDADPWKSVAAEKFSQPVSPSTIKLLIQTRLDELRTASKEFVPQFEIPREVDFGGAFFRSPEAYKMLMQRFSGVFMMALIIGGISVPGLIKSLFNASPTWTLLISVPCFLLLLTALSLQVLRSARAETMVIAQVKVRETLLKLQRKALNDIVSDVSKALDRNAKEGLEDLIRRLRSDLESPAAQQKHHWQSRVANLQAERAKLVEQVAKLERCGKHIEETIKTLKQSGAKLAAKMFKAAGIDG